MQLQTPVKQIAAIHDLSGFGKCQSITFRLISREQVIVLPVY